MFSDCGGYPIGAIVPCREYGGRMQYAPTRVSDNGRCHSFASEMFPDGGRYLSGAIVLGPEHRGRMQYAPTRVSDNGRCRSFASEMFSDGVGSLSGAIVLGHEHGGRMLLRPYTDVRRRRLTFIRPQNVFRLRRIPDRRYCSRP